MTMPPMTDTAGQPAPASPLEHALRYVEVYGLALCLIRPGTKRPMMAAWNDPTRTLRTPDAVRAVNWETGYGMGLVHEQSRTGGWDIDNQEWTRLVCAEFGFDYDAWMGAFPRIRTRANKDKILFHLPAGFTPGAQGIPTKLVLRWPDPTGECDARGNPKLVTVFELRGGDNQDVLPPSIHPDTQQPYAWARAPWDFADGIPVLPPDHPLLVMWAQWDRFRPQLERACPWFPAALQPTVPTVQRLTSTEHGNIIGRYNRAVTCADLLEQHGYTRRGKRWLAPHSSTKIPGVIALSEGKVYSHHGSDILNTGHAHDAFSLLTVLECNQNINLALGQAKLLLSEPAEPDVPLIDPTPLIAAATAKAAAARTQEPRKPPSAPPVVPQIPDWLITQAPGLVGDILRFGLATAPKPLPHLTLQAAFAILSAAASRKYRTTRNNWPSLWFLNIEKTASGKEHPETLADLVLDAAGLGWLVAGAGYTSSGAVFSTALERPAHLAIVDEFGKMMQSSQAAGSQQKIDAITILMQAFGRCHGILRPPAYSAMGLSQSQRKEALDRKIHNPGIVLLAGTTPGTFYDSISSQWVQDGFLGRFLVAHSQVGRQLSRHVDVQAVPETIKTRLREIARLEVPAGELVKVGEINMDASQEAQPIVVDFHPDASARFHAFEADIQDSANAAERWGLDALFGRTVEKALRLALLVCLAEDTQGRTITGDQARYAIEYARAMDTALVEQAKLYVSDSPFARVRNLCLEHIRQGGKLGLTQRELGRKCRPFDALRPREQQEILEALQGGGEVSLAVLAGAGRKRAAWIAVDVDGDA